MATAGDRSLTHVLSLKRLKTFPAVIREHHLQRTRVETVWEISATYSSLL